MQTQGATDELWSTQPHIIRKFLELRPQYEKLAQEVAYIVANRARKHRIEVAAVTYRVKELESFCEKVVRKKYLSPLNDVSDLSGVRVVYLYKSDKKKLECLIEKAFKVIEKSDTVEAKGPEQFGYGALHYLVNVGASVRGPRYEDLKKLTCEIQVRTVLQDAWAVIAHHLSYKQEADVPAELRRKLNALSGAIETADNQFDQVRDERVSYAARLKQEIATDSQEFLSAPLNLDSLTEYLAWKFPNRERSSRGSVSELVEELRTLGCSTLGDCDSTIRRTFKAVCAHETKYPPKDGELRKTKYTSVGLTRVAFYFLNKEYRNRKFRSGRFRREYEEFEGLIEEEN